MVKTTDCQFICSPEEWMKHMLAMLAPVCEAKMGQTGMDTHHTTALCILLCSRPA